MESDFVEETCGADEIDVITVKMSTKLRHSQRVKQKLEEKLENLKSLEDKLHTTIRNHVSKAEHKCHEMLSVDNTSEFLSQYGKVAQFLEAASNTIDLLTISAEELIENAGFDETISWSDDKTLLSSTNVLSEGTLCTSDINQHVDANTQTRPTNSHIDQNVQTSESHNPVNCDNLLRSDLNDQVCCDNKTEHSSCTCNKFDMRTLVNSLCKDCIQTRKHTSNASSQRNKTERIKGDITEICDSAVDERGDDKLVDNSEISKTGGRATSVPTRVKKSLSKGMSDVDTSQKAADEALSVDDTLQYCSGPSVKASTPVRKKKPKWKGTKMGVPQSDVSCVDQTHVSKTDENTEANVEACVKQCVTRYSEFEEELCGELNKQSTETAVSSHKSQTNELSKRSFDPVNEIDKEIGCLNDNTCSSTKQNESKNAANVNELKQRGLSDTGCKSVSKPNLDNKVTGTTRDEVEVDVHTNENLSDSKTLTAGSLLSGKITPVIVCEIVSPWCFFVQRNGPQLTQMMEQICEYMRRTGINEPPLLDVKLGVICLARYSTDATYYRAYITQIYKSLDSSQAEVDVLYVDYGNRERVKTKDLRTIPQQFMSLPSQAICCALAEVMPCNKYCVWAEDDVILFRQYVTGQSLSCVPSSIRTSASTIPQIVELTVNYPVLTTNSLPDAAYIMNQFSIGKLMIQGKRARQVDVPEQIRLLVKSGEGMEEVSILRHNTESAADTGLHIAEIVETISSPLKEPAKCKSAPSEVVAAEQTVGIDKESASHEQSVSKVSVKEVEGDVDNLQGDIGTETVVKTNLESKQEAKLVNKNNDSLKSEPSETESLCAEKLPDEERAGGCGQLDRIKEEITETGSCDNMSIVTSASNDADFLLDHDASHSDLHYDITYLQFNPQGQEVMLSHVKTPHEFYVHIISQQCGEALDSLMKNLNLIFEKVNRRKLARLSKMYEPVVNKLCCAQFLQDNNFYRGVIKSTKPEQRKLDGCVLIHYIDFGDEEWLPRKRIFPLPPQFCKVPRLALKCNLVYIKPVSNKCEPVKWSGTSIKKFIEIAGLEKTLHMLVVHGSLDDFKHCDPSEDMPTLGVLLVDNTGPEEVCINIDMINEGVAELDSSHTKGKVDHSEEDEADLLNRWNPKAEDFFSKRNSYNIDTDDVGVATTGYKIEDESKICKFYLSGRTCWRGERCSFKHVRVHSGVTHEQDEVYAITDTQGDYLPSAGSWVAMEITTILSPNHFYAILPLGNKSLDQSVSKSEQSEDSCMGVTGQEETLDDLLAALSREYKKRSSHEGKLLLKALGQMVVARYSADQQWYRARVVSVTEDRVKVFYVDFGNTEWLPEDELADIKPEYLHLPFQAIECFVNIECNHGDQWSKESKSVFLELVDGKTLVGHIKWCSWNGCLWLDLYDTTTDEDISIGNVMVEKGFARLIDVPINDKVNTGDMTTSWFGDDEVLIPG